MLTSPVSSSFCFHPEITALLLLSVSPSFPLCLHPPLSFSLSCLPPTRTQVCSLFHPPSLPPSFHPSLCLPPPLPTDSHSFLALKFLKDTTGSEVAMLKIRTLLCRSIFQRSKHTLYRRKQLQTGSDLYRCQMAFGGHLSVFWIEVSASWESEEVSGCSLGIISAVP